MHVYYCKQVIFYSKLLERSDIREELRRAYVGTTVEIEPYITPISYWNTGLKSLLSSILNLWDSVLLSTETPDLHWFNWEETKADMFSSDPHALKEDISKRHALYQRVIVLGGNVITVSLK